jgi:hypothetical protein
LKKSDVSVQKDGNETSNLPKKDKVEELVHRMKETEKSLECVVTKTELGVIIDCVTQLK